MLLVFPVVIYCLGAVHILCDKNANYSTPSLPPPHITRIANCQTTSTCRALCTCIRPTVLCMPLWNKWMTTMAMTMINLWSIFFVFPWFQRMWSHILKRTSTRTMTTAVSVAEALSTASPMDERISRNVTTSGTVWAWPTSGVRQETKVGSLGVGWTTSRRSVGYVICIIAY